MTSFSSRRSLAGSVDLFNKSPLRRGSLNRASISLFTRSLSLRNSLFNTNTQEPEPSVASVPRNENWNSVQVAVLQLFQKQRLTDGELANLYNNVRNLVNSKVGPYVYDYYKNELLKRSLADMRDFVHGDDKNDNDTELLERLGESWDYFFREILPLLQAILHPIEMKKYSVRQATLLEFRDTVLFNSNLEVYLESEEPLLISSALKQMLLVLQAIPDGSPPSENYKRLERLTAKYIVPYLGLQGLYIGKIDPEFPALVNAYYAASEDEVNLQNSCSQIEHSKSTSNLLLTHMRQNSQPNPAKHMLKPVIENDNIERRHSMSTVEECASKEKFTM